MRTLSARAVGGPLIQPPRCRIRASPVARGAVARRFESFRDHADQPRREFRLAGARQFTAAAGPVHRQRVVVAVEREAVAHLVRRDHVEALGLELRERIAFDILRLGREPDDERARAAGRHGREDVRRARERKQQRVAGLLDLLRRDLQRPVVRHGRGGDEDVGAGQVRADGRHHLLGRLDARRGARRAAPEGSPGRSPARPRRRRRARLRRPHSPSSRNCDS